MKGEQTYKTNDSRNETENPSRVMLGHFIPVRLDKPSEYNKYSKGFLKPPFATKNFKPYGVICEFKWLYARNFILLVEVSWKLNICH